MIMPPAFNRSCRPTLRLLRLAAVLAAGCAPAVAAWQAIAENPFVDAATGTHLGVQTGPATSQAADAALRSGFPAIAARLAAQALASMPADDALRPAVQRTLLSALLASDQRAAARQALADIAEPRPAAVQLRAVLLDFLDNRDTWQNRVDSVVSAALDPDDYAWWAFLRSIKAQSDGDLDAAGHFLSQAELAVSQPMTRAYFSLFRWRQELARGGPPESLIGSLRQTAMNLAGESGAIEANRLLAIALAQAGRRDEAVAVLERQLPAIALSAVEPRAQYQLLIGFCAGAGSERGRQSLVSLLGDGAASRSTMEMGLLLLLQQAGVGESFHDFVTRLDGWLDAPRPHPLRDQLLAARAFLSADRGNLTQAEADARQIVINFPNSALSADALRLLIWLSLQRTPARYRTAADYLQQLRQRLSTEAERARMAALMGDCFFLNGDYPSAAAAYSDALRDAQGSEAARLVFQLVLAEIRAQRVDVAISYLDSLALDHEFAPAVLWEIEWNLVDVLKSTGRLADAQQRVTRLVTAPLDAEPGAPPLATGRDSPLFARMQWLDARLTLDAGDPQRALAKARALLQRLDAPAATTPAPVDPAPSRAEFEAVIGQALLLAGECHLDLGNPSDALERFSQLRERFPESGPAIQSYLVESRLSVREDALVSAQQTLLGIADKFPASRYAPLALWEAALNAEQRGLNPHLQEAIAILERLTRAYPQHELAFHARLKQGDLSRRLNDFSSALILYERLIQQFPQHPARHRAEMSRGDCLLAMGSTDRNRLEDAALLFERLALQTALPAEVRLESGVKWASALKLRDQALAAEDALWLIAQAFIPDQPGAPALGPRGRYWLSRALLELANLRETRGDSQTARRHYLTIVRTALPGASFARSRAEALAGSPASTSAPTP
jgi:cellulose synthase operon protein C